MITGLGALRSLAPDVLLVGTGPAGLSIALALEGSGLDVVALTGGAFDVDDASQDLYRSDVVGLAHGGVYGLRFRAHGGSSRRWAGQALPLLDIDFEERPWVELSGWPIAPADLEPYVDRVHATLGVARFPTTEPWDHPKGVRRPQFDPAVATMYFSKFSARPDLAKRFHPELDASRRLEIVVGAHATAIEMARTGDEVSRVVVRELNGTERVLQPKVTVICAGGIESARLLLAAAEHDDRVLGEGAELVGRCFMDHYGITWAARRWNDLDLVRESFAPHRTADGKHAVFTASSPELQRRLRMLHMCSPVVFDPPALAALDAARALRSTWSSGPRAETVRNVGRIVAGSLEVAPVFWHRYVRRQVAIDPRRPPLLAIGGEQAPNPRSRVTLAEERDALGMRRTRLEWRLTELDVHSMRAWAPALAAEFERLGLAEFDLGDLRIDDDPDALVGLSDAGHHMGTTRMSADGRTGVVDRNCRVHGITNLFVASSSVFPTGGFSNPTYTLMALAERLAEHLRDLLGGRT